MDESQTLMSEVLILVGEILILVGESQTLVGESQTLVGESQTLVSESQTLVGESQILIRQVMAQTPTPHKENQNHPATAAHQLPESPLLAVTDPNSSNSPAQYPVFPTPND
jgi:hypothetical protein